MAARTASRRSSASPRARHSDPTPVRDAEAAFAATPRRAPGGGSLFPVPTSRTSGQYLVLSAALVTLLVVSVVLAIPVAAGAGRHGCQLITYAFQDGAPRQSRAELRLAAQEIHRHTGLRFEEGQLGSAQLVVRWSEVGVTGGARSPIVLGPEKRRALGFGEGRWRRAGGGRELVTASIEIDATAPWPLGLDRRDALGAVFVHELGHVIGLRHSPDPRSFMHGQVSPRPPRWTIDDLDQLAHAGRQSGCRPPTSTT